MTSREHFERWMKHRKPNMPLDFDEESQYYYHDIAQHMFLAWNERGQHRPTENSKITKEQLAEDHPETLVDRLNGIHPLASPPYVVPPIQREAAREIEHLRYELDIYKGGMRVFDTVDELMEDLNSPDNERPAEADGEIERLREGIQELINALGTTQRIFGKTPLSKESGKQWMRNVDILEKYSRHNNKKPAEAG